jgi:hypothetical protein
MFWTNLSGLSGHLGTPGYREHYPLNYTWSKAMGIVGGTSPTTDSFGATLNPFNLASNYGTLPGDRRQIFNAVYSIGLPSPLLQSTPGGPITLNNRNFGISNYKTGHRIVEMMAKFYF